jgi:hypothetical protein
VKRQYHIVDWAGNIMFDGITFATYEDAWSHIYEMLPNADDQALSEYHVDLTKESK